MKFKPLGARAMVKEVEREQTTESRIVLSDTAKEKPQNAEVVAMGAHEDVKVSLGDVVVVRKYAGTEVGSTGRTTGSWTPKTSSGWSRGSVRLRLANDHR